MLDILGSNFSYMVFTELSFLSNSTPPNLLPCSICDVLKWFIWLRQVTQWKVSTSAKPVTADILPKPEKFIGSIFIKRKLLIRKSVSQHYHTILYGNFCCWNVFSICFLIRRLLLSEVPVLVTWQMFKFLHFSVCIDCSIKLKDPSLLF